jgi:hypothetical protein
VSSQTFGGTGKIFESMKEEEEIDLALGVFAGFLSSSGILHFVGGGRGRVESGL